MTLIKSISGIRGTIGGLPGNSLTPLDIVRFTSAFGLQLIARQKKTGFTVVIGRDARISGEMVSMLVAGSLMGMGINVIDLGFASTPTVELGVIYNKADGGIILTASHNPGQWNALKLLNAKVNLFRPKTEPNCLPWQRLTKLSMPRWNILAN
jgi:phosphomannomutase